MKLFPSTGTSRLPHVAPTSFNDPFLSAVGKMLWCLTCCLTASLKYAVCTGWIYFRPHALYAAEPVLTVINGQPSSAYLSAGGRYRKCSANKCMLTGLVSYRGIYIGTLIFISPVALWTQQKLVLIKSYVFFNNRFLLRFFSYVWRTNDPTGARTFMSCSHTFSMNRCPSGDRSAAAAVCLKALSSC